MGASAVNGRAANKVVIVTGAASNPGLGRATAQRLAAEGAKVVVTDVDAAGAEDCAATIQAAGGTALALQQDVTQESRWQEVISATVEAYGSLDVLALTVSKRSIYQACFWAVSTAWRKWLHRATAVR